MPPADDPKPSAPITQEMLTQILKEQLKPINEKLDHLVAASPHAAMTIERKNNVLVGTVGEYREEMARGIVQGGSATWTFMRIKGTDNTEEMCFAVSCEHCALAYKIANRRTGQRFRFVSLPVELIRCGILWVGLSHGHKYGPSPPKRSSGSDMTIVILREFPDHIHLDSVPIWPSPLSITDFPASLIVSGWSTTGAVHGSHCARTSDHLVFVESSGEAGNSGTLMYLLYPGKTTLIGIYVGIMPPERGADLKVRGLICPFPKRLQDKFLRHDPTPNRDAPPSLRIETEPRRCLRRNSTLFEKIVAQGNPYYRRGLDGDRNEYGILVGANGTVLPDKGGLSQGLL